MRKIVHRVNTPLVARSVMMSVHDTVNNRVAHIKVWRRHIYFCPQNLCACFKLAVCHTSEKVEIFFNASVAIRRIFARLGERTPVFFDFVSRKVIDISPALFDELDCAIVDEVEIIACKINIVPIKAEPLNIFLNRLDILGVLFNGVGIVKTEVANAVVFVFHAEVDANCLCVADMQIAVGLGRETGLNS